MKKKKSGGRRRKGQIIICVLLMLLTIGVAFAISQNTAKQPEALPPLPEVMLGKTAQGTPAPEPATPTETPYPKPTYIPTLRQMDCNDKSSDIWYPCNPSSYIEPNNEWVKYYASHLFVDYDGRIKYKNEKVVWWKDINGTVYYTYKSFINNYVYDWEQFGTGSQGSLPNDDYWANVDYYLTHGTKGDCDEWMNVVTSMMLSGEMSLWQGDKLVKRIIPAKAVMGYMQNTKDGWVEYQVYNKNFITSTAREVEAITGNKISQTWYVVGDKLFNLYKPVFEFTDKYFRRI